MYSIVCTRLEIVHSVSIVCKYMVEPSKLYWEALKWIFRYVKGSLDIDLLYKGGAANEAYTDSDFAGCLDTRRSISGYIFVWF
ncbi:Retrovirus-related Pol polyprotein from transposon TNT 1-94 [Dendrobium catenatum]|uniref:Retrovirus-related Pol polyprotein from transposon TNT 1-94 n=1 Tax=Dendrobium catenatum TaxID=906689 RepID=A0A2I0X1T3_9ASPA|nr:Retrovirus-related Pol polyprotein from transposon TNT 1-94 [Dendrobium catenatum]